MIQYRRQLVDFIKTRNLPIIAAELGCAEGLFSNDLLASGLDRLYMVDNWGEIVGQKGDGGSPQEWHDKNFTDAVSRVEKYEGKAIFLRGFSDKMAKFVDDHTLGLLYVDCDHSYSGVTKDIHAWYSKVVSGGVIAFHDYENENYGVKNAVKDFVDGRFEIHPIPEDKKEDAGAYFIKP